MLLVFVWVILVLARTRNARVTYRDSTMVIFLLFLMVYLFLNLILFMRVLSMWLFYFNCVSLWCVFFVLLCCSSCACTMVFIVARSSGTKGMNILIVLIILSVFL